MRSVELTKVALSAEALRLRTMAKRQGMRGAYGAGAAVFAVAVLVVLHVLIWFVAAIWLSPIWCTVVLLVIDLIAAGVLGYLAMQNVPSTIEVEAQQIKVQAVAELKRSLTVMGMASEVAGAALRNRTRTGVQRSVARIAAEMASRLIGR